MFAHIATEYVFKTCVVCVYAAAALYGSQGINLKHVFVCFIINVQNKFKEINIYKII